VVGAGEAFGWLTVTGGAVGAGTVCGSGVELDTGSAAPVAGTPTILAFGGGLLVLDCVVALPCVCATPFKTSGSDVATTLES